MQTGNDLSTDRNILLCNVLRSVSVPFLGRYADQEGSGTPYAVQVTMEPAVRPLSEVEGPRPVAPSAPKGSSSYGSRLILRLASMRLPSKLAAWKE